MANICVQGMTVSNNAIPTPTLEVHGSDKFLLGHRFIRKQPSKFRRLVLPTSPYLRVRCRRVVQFSLSSTSNWNAGSSRKHGDTGCASLQAKRLWSSSNDGCPFLHPVILAPRTSNIPSKKIANHSHLQYNSEILAIHSRDLHSVESQPEVYSLASHRNSFN